MYVYLPKFRKQMHYYDPYRSTVGFFYYIIIRLGQNMTPIGK